MQTLMQPLRNKNTLQKDVDNDQIEWTFKIIYNITLKGDMLHAL